MKQKCKLQLSDGEVLEGRLIGAPITASGEMVFTTGMVGYTETMSDPSYFGQILVFSYPLIGNYGVPALTIDPQTGDLPSGFESTRITPAAIALTEESESVFHWNSVETLDHWMKRFGVPGIVGVDTRRLVQAIRQQKNLLGRIEPERPEGASDLLKLFKSSQDSKFFDPGLHEILPSVSIGERKRVGKGKVRIGVIDCGVKWNIIRQLLQLGCEVEILPWNTDFGTVDCHGWLISNGPGDPTRTGDLIARVRTLLQQTRPVLGICLGHQILALAAGGKTERMAFGHRGHNQPVQLQGTKKGFMTSQNHGYVVLNESLGQEWEPWFFNVNDRTSEGIRHRSGKFRSVQFHPEAAGGPRDTGWILKEFAEGVIR